MSTTTSTQASGLLDILLPEFEKDTGIKVKVIAKGTGAAIRDGIDGNVDIIFVHAKAREEKFIADGYGTKRYAVMHNDFVIVGPPGDPAMVAGLNSTDEALARISNSGSSFVSRGDDSGTHKKELALWNEANIMPAGEWYLESGQGMGATLKIASEKSANHQPDKLKTDECVDPGHYIIHHDADTAVQVAVKPGYRKWFHDIEESEQNKAQ